MVNKPSFGEVLERASKSLDTALRENPLPWLLLTGLHRNEDTGYAGKRCGWYPEKPRRIRAARR